MKKFIFKIIIFLAILGFLFFLGIFIPATPASKNNMLAFKIQKDSLLRATESPRIIFVGGSNLVFGLNSQIIKDSLRVNPINNGLVINVGLIYMMNDVLPYIRKNDIIILAPEYQLYFGKLSYGGNDLFRLLMDVDRKGFRHLEFNQYLSFARSAPIYVLNKFKYQNYFINDENIYGKDIFNKYGDSEFHWSFDYREFEKFKPINSSFNREVLKKIGLFEKEVKSKGAKLFVTFPSCQQSYLEDILSNVEKVQNELKSSGFDVIGTPRRYSFPDSLIFDSPYHLNKKGVDLRTLYFIKDLESFPNK